MSHIYLIDTNICVFMLRGKFNLDRKIKEIGFEKCYISEITVAELLYGAFCSKYPENNLMAVNRFCSMFKVLSISECLKTFALEKSILRTQGNIIDDFDLLIGATAKFYNMILVTDNFKHFERLNLSLENWIVR